MPFTGTITNQVVATLTDADPVGDLAAGVAATSKVTTLHGVRLATGTGAGQADLMFSDTRTLGDGSSEDLDLAGSLSDAFGGTITNLRVKAIYIKSSSANTTDLTVGAGTNPWATLLNSAGTITLRPGASFQAIAGEADATAWTVTAGTGDVLQVSNGGGATADYDVVVIGASA